MVCVTISTSEATTVVLWVCGFIQPCVISVELCIGFERLFPFSPELARLLIKYNEGTSKPK